MTSDTTGAAAAGGEDGNDPARGNFIAGAWTGAASGEHFERRDPADTSQLIGRFPASGPADVDAAVAGVRDGYGEWAATAPERRAEVLEAAADQLARQADELAAELVREEGKTLAEARMEVSRTPANLRYFAAEAVRLLGETYPTADGGLLLTLRQPVGVVGAITPWNFPMNIPSRKLAPALAAGNGVVFKPSEITPLLGQRLVEALLAAGLPPGAIALVQGDGAAGGALAAHPDVAAITFTGSTAVGTKIHHAGGPTRRTQLEMGGKNAVVVLADADLDRAATLIAKGAFGLSGQACTGTSRVVVDSAVHQPLLERLVALAESRRIGSGLQDGVEMGPQATRAQADKVLDYVAVGQQEGAKLVTGGEALTEGEYARGHFVSPAIFTGVTPTMRLAQEEVFGPLLALLQVDGLEQAIEVVNATAYGLSSGIVTSDLAQALRFARESQTGLVKVNQPTTGVAMNAPFGGFKNSSTQTFKEQGGPTMMHFYTQEKTVYVSS